MSADAAHPNPDVARRLQHIYTLHRTDIDLRLGETSPYEILLHKLGDPHKKLPPVVHVAGTNGKGSTLAFTRAVLEAAGYTVHAYTSPHLITFNERIRLAGNLISDAALINLYDRVLAASAGTAITFFEFTTAMAFLAFAENRADILLLETGMGGRLDCTNVVEAPLCTAITKISFDHTEFLGSTLPLIAAEKAGIMKAGIPCVIGPQMDWPAVLPVFENAAKIQGAPLKLIGQNGTVSLPQGYPSPSLAGAHQIENAATALAIIDILVSCGFDVPDGARRKGLSHTNWPARLQNITTGPIAALLPQGWELWFDAAHNDSGALALADQLKAWKNQAPAMPIHMIVGLGADKDVTAFFGAFKGLYDTLTFVDLPQARKPSSAAHTRAKLVDAPLTECYENRDIKGAVSARVEGHSPYPARLVICGSLYLYAQMLAPAT